MGGGSGEAGELFFGLEAEAKAGVAAGVDDFLELGVVAFAGDADVVEFSAPRAQGLFDRVQPVKNLHLFSLNCCGQYAIPERPRPMHLASRYVPIGVLRGGHHLLHH